MNNIFFFYKFEKKSMKKSFYILSLFFTLTFLHSQTGQGYGIGSNGVQSDGRLIDIFENIKNRANSATKATASIKELYKKSFFYKKELLINEDVRNFQDIIGKK